MATKYQPTKQSLPDKSLWQWLQRQFSLSYQYADGRGGTPGQFNLELQPQGYYSGYQNTALNDNNTILTNPWGVSAAPAVRQNFLSPNIDPMPDFVLQGGQSIDFRNGRLSDPKLHASTAARLNQAIQLRQIHEVGLEQAGETSARQSKSVLASLDDLYFANQATSVPTSEALSSQAQAKQGGLDTMNRKTLLGIQKPVAPVAAPNPFER